MGTASLQPQPTCLAVVVTAQFLLMLLLMMPGTAILAVGEISQDIPFLDTDDPELICASAIQYLPHLKVTSESSLPQPRTVTLTTQPATDAHGTQTSTSFPDSSPITINVDSTIYTPRHPMQVVISSTTPFRGFMLHARRVGQSTVVGRFVVSASTTSPAGSADILMTAVAGDIRSVNCDGPEDTIFNWKDSSYNESFTWIAPDDDIGPVHFVATVFHDVDRYWTNVTSSVIRKGQWVIRPTDDLSSVRGSESTVFNLLYIIDDAENTSFIPIDLSTCGKTKGCFRYCSTDERQTCDSQSSIYALTYHVIDNNAHFELTAAAEWVAVGFSSDESMGGDDVFLCSRNRVGTGSVRTYFTDLSYVPPTLKAENTLFNAEFEATTTVSKRGTHQTRVSCRFSRPMKVMFDQQSVDLSNNWYQLYAWGSISTSGDTINKHSLDKPPTSAQKLTLRVSQNHIISGSVAATRPLLDGRYHLAVVFLMITLLVGCRWNAC